MKREEEQSEFEKNWAGEQPPAGPITQAVDAAQAALPDAKVDDEAEKARREAEAAAAAKK